MPKKIYVGNLSYNVNDDQLREFFSQAGEVASASVLINKMSGLSRGFGFVEMADDAGFDKALELNGTDMAGRKLVVNEARPPEARAPRPRGGRDY